MFWHLCWTAFLFLFYRDSFKFSWWRTPNDSSLGLLALLHGQDRAPVNNKYAWTNATSMLYIEQPVETDSRLVILPFYE
jgi:hypothetical protein